LGRQLYASVVILRYVIAGGGAAFHVEGCLLFRMSDILSHEADNLSKIKLLLDSRLAPAASHRVVLSSGSLYTVLENTAIRSRGFAS